VAERSFPLIDFKELKKGQVLEVPYLETLFGVKRDDTRYQHKIRALTAEIKKYRDDLYPRSASGTVRIMDDAEAAHYNILRVESTLNAVVRTVVDGARVDRNKLTAGQRADFDAKTQVTAAIAIEASGQRTKLELARALKEGK
jgi:mannose/fructose/N-acetylgalactosamine-specific phosphotransferase system component IIB